MEITEDIKKLIEVPTRPDLSDILPLAKARGIDSPCQLWHFFDEIQKLWADSKYQD